ncbi:MAG TPA: replication-relaxation family protein [Ktedonobacterales bacterium]|nr:replication-relaxation family protein [Ktedonobacterales bacterium]
MAPFHAFRMRPSYDVLLRGSPALPFGLYHLQLATAEQLCRLHYKPGMLTTVKARLKELTDHHFTQADAVGAKHVGDRITFSARYYYTLGQEGVRYLQRCGLDTHEAWRATKEIDKHALFVDHTLEVNDLLISAALVGQVDSQYHVETFVHDRVLKRNPFEVKLAGRTFRLVPDAYVVFYQTFDGGSQRRLPVFLEHDRDTEGQTFFRHRIRAYIALLKSDVIQQRFGVGTITVAFTTFTHHKRLEEMRAWTLAELDASHETRHLGEAFLFDLLPPAPPPATAWFGSHWYLAYQDQQRSTLLS